MGRLKVGPLVGAAIILIGGGGFIYVKSSQKPRTPVAAEVVPVTSAVGAIVETVPAGTVSIRLCGSNTIGAELAPALIEEFLKQKGATGIQRSSGPDTALVKGTLAGEPFSADVKSAGTSTAFQAMAAGQCDIAMASREATPAERDTLGQGLTEQVLGLDGIAVIVHPTNPISKLLTTQVGVLFSGASWAVVGGNGPVDVVSYDEKSGTFDTFKKLALAGQQLSPNSKKLSSSADVVGSVISAPSAIGYTSLSSARGVKILAIGEPGAEPLMPTPWTVARESYPFTRRLYLYTHARFTRPAADSLVTFALSNAGQAVVDRMGFVDLSVKAEPYTLCSTCPAAYQQTTAGGRRLSVDFRFRNGSSELDSRALRDADRVAEFGRTGQRLQLIGFADNSGDPSVNQKLSLERAEKVRAELGRRGLTALQTQGLGSLMPTASNATEEGRQKNRRVEVWVH